MTLGCIFDCDGVVVDSAPLHIVAWKQLCGEEGRQFPERLFPKSFGMKNEQIIPQLFKWTTDPREIKRIDERKEWLFRELVRTRGAATFPGVKSFLTMLHKRRVPCVIGSSAPRANVDAALATLGFTGFFKAVVSGEDAAVGKPDPQIFLRCAEALKQKPSQCVVFEDAHVGIAAARAARMKVVAVANTFPAESLGGADLVIDRIDRLEFNTLQRLFES
jgi:beta-phosphoglucomutase family hydrolase